MILLVIMSNHVIFLPTENTPAHQNKKYLIASPNMLSKRTDKKAN